jgi:ABC-type multidrug transport system ATPase subunit
VGPPEPLLRAEAVTKRFRGVAALSGVGFSVRSGEVLGLIGPNGSGKTTLFECLAGVLPADAGRVTYQGRPLSAAERSTVLFYLPDAIAPWPAQRTRWAIDFFVDFFGGNRQALPEIVNRLGLDLFLDVPLGQLSKGQRKRALVGMGCWRRTQYCWLTNRSTASICARAASWPGYSEMPRRADGRSSSPFIRSPMPPVCAIDSFC